ncbi:hypothetical protein [Mucilaginibacter sp. OK098]|uniref:hypothetical protein n=1 Tax=Mucilaginibacter sp. OK098 TaxID=1855297 RepID=UPI00091C50B4|nr:hypothetical protein [Mucilaginibacter sp. OK098]SHN26238.1 hypothetical protein SAMN05216524_107395 [Mucilaginibacter sp. OK098]
MSKFLPLISIIVCIGVRAASAQPSPDSLHSAKSAWGTIVGERKAKSYTTRDGRHTYAIGGTVHTGLGSAEDKSFQYVRAHVSGNRFVKALVPDIAALEKEYEDTDFTVTDIYEGYSKVSDALVRNAPKTVFVVFQTAARSSYEAAIEKAIRAKEIETN